MNPEVIKQIKNTPIGGNELVAMLGNYKSATMKLSAMEHAGEVVRLKRGLYVVDGGILGFPRLPLFAPTTSTVLHTSRCSGH